jgi:hypothetical protein
MAVIGIRMIRGAVGRAGLHFITGHARRDWQSSGSEPGGGHEVKPVSCLFWSQCLSRRGRRLSTGRTGSRSIEWKISIASEKLGSFSQSSIDMLDGHLRIGEG